MGVIYPRDVLYWNFKASANELGILDRFRMARGSKAYGIIEAILVAIKGFSSIDRQKILSGLAAQSPEDLIRKFANPHKYFLESVKGHVTDEALERAYDNLLNDCIREVEGFINHKMDDVGRESLKSNLQSVFAEDFNQAKGEILRGRMNLLKEKFSESELMNGRNFNCLAIYCEMCKMFFDIDSRKPPLSKELSNKPRYPDAINFDGEKFVAVSPKYKDCAETANDLRIRLKKMHAAESYDFSDRL
jgi:hypothetical protein